MIPYALKNFRSYLLAHEFNRECKTIKLSPHLRDQLTRASESILLTLAEGSAKPTAKDRARFYAMALGSFRECQSILNLSDEINLLERYDRLGAFLYRLTYSARQS